MRVNYPPPLPKTIGSEHCFAKRGSRAGHRPGVGREARGAEPRGSTAELGRGTPASFARRGVGGTAKGSVRRRVTVRICCRRTPDIDTKCGLFAVLYVCCKCAPTLLYVCCKCVPTLYVVMRTIAGTVEGIRRGNTTGQAVDHYATGGDTLVVPGSLRREAGKKAGLVWKSQGSGGERSIGSVNLSKEERNCVERSS